MRPVPTLIATAAAIALPAFAQAPSDQGPGANQAPSAAQTLNPTTGAGAPPVPGDAKAAAKPAPVGDARNTSATLPVIPSNWGGDARDWTLHTAACAKAYGTYDQATDLFTNPSGRPQKCMLAMGKGALRKR